MPIDELQYKSDSDHLGLVQTPKVKGHGPQQPTLLQMPAESWIPGYPHFRPAGYNFMCGGWWERESVQMGDG